VSAPAALFGLGLALAGWLAARAVTVARAERVLSLLGSSPRAFGRPGLGIHPPRWLGERAGQRSWPGSAWSYLATLVVLAIGGAWFGSNVAGPVGAMVGAAAGPTGTEVLLSRRLAAATVRAEEHLRDVILSLSAGVRAGLSIRRALQEAARDAGPPLDAALNRLVVEQGMGARLEESLEGLADGLELPDLRLVVTVLAVHRRTGGDLPAMLEGVAEVVGDRVRSRHEVRALTAQGRASGAILALLPVAFVALLSGTGGEALGAFYRSPPGVVLLLTGLGCEVAGFLWIRRIVARAEADR
jgi:tight adherence protein B